MPSYPAFLVPGGLPPQDPGHDPLHGALATVKDELADASVALVFVTLAAWRTVYFEMGAADGASKERLRPIAEALKAREIGVSLTPPPHLDGFEKLRSVLFPGQKALVVPLSVALKSPEAATQFGVALRDILEQMGVGAAFVASGHLSYSLPAQKSGQVVPEGEAFDRKLIEVLEKGAGDQILNLDPRLWFTATPEADLGFLFPLTGFVGAGATASALAYHIDPGKGSCVMRFFPPRKQVPGKMIFLEDRSESQ